MYLYILKHLTCSKLCNLKYLLELEAFNHFCFVNAKTFKKKRRRKISKVIKNDFKIHKFCGS